MKICGIMLAKKNSNRFPEKNKLLFEKNLNNLISICGNENVYMFSNDIDILRKCDGYNINYSNRGINAIDDDQSYLDLIKYSYMQIDEKYDFIVSVLCNSINNTIDDIKKCLNIISKNEKLTLCRSYNQDGIQSGIFVFRPENFPLIWYDECCILNSGKEIHYKDELNG